MPAERRLATYVHVSDVHFGDLDASTGNATLDSNSPAWWRLHRLFDGYLGHSYDALIHLTDLFGRLEDEEGASLIVSGDLTACGKPEHFDLARRFFTSGLAMDPSTSNQVGLNVADALARTIPGNHDHWPGSRLMFGEPTAGFSDTFPELPLPIARLPLGNGRTLVLAGIDSDADVRPGFPSAGRMFARGSFVSQLQLLTGLLGPPRPDEIRVLLMHHSRMHPGYSHGIQAKSRKALDQLIERRDICVVLTGHLHVPRGEVFSVRNRDGASWDVLEARSGTTLQRDELPIEWSVAGKRAKLPPNTLLVHRLVELDGKRIEWRTRCYRRSRMRGFRDEGLLEGARPIRVWPRPWHGAAE